jgi:hypothetical protein
MNKHIIDDPKEIENLYYSFRKKKTEVTLKYDLKETTAQIYRITSIFLTLFYKGNINPRIKTIEMTMSADASIYSAISRVIKISSGELTVALPEQLEKRVKRKHRRIDSKEGIYLRFNVISDINDKLDFLYDKGRVSNKFLEARKELVKPVPDIKKAITIISSELRGNTSIFEVKLYKQGEVYPKRINVLKEVKKTIFISNTKDKHSYLKSLSINGVVSYLPYIRDIRKTMHDDKDSIKAEFASIMQEDAKLSLVSYICSPIMLYEKVIGHIFLGLTKEFNSKFSGADAYTVKVGCDIISKTIAKNKLHQLNTGDDFDILVTDLGGGGLSMQLSDQYILLKHLSIFTKLSMVLKLNEREIKVVTTINRIDKQENNDAIIAVKFTDINWTEQEYIDKYVNRQIEIDKMQNVN